MTLENACSVRFYVGAGLPGRLRASRFKGLPVSFDQEAFDRLLRRELGKAFPGMTTFRARGTWKGGGEDSLVVEVFEAPRRQSGCAVLFKRASRVAKVLARKLGQEAVLVVATDADGRVKKDFVKAA